MRDLAVFLRRFAMPYKWNIVWSVVFNILTSLMTIFSFAFIVPILQMLFGLDSTHYEYIEPGSKPLKDMLIGNFYWYMDRMIAEDGASRTLAWLALLLICTTFLKVITAYLSEVCTLPLRNGVTRDIRNSLYNKILSLPIGFFTNERKGDIIARISGDVSEVENSVMASLFSLVKYPVMIIVCLVAMVAISWQLTVFVFVLLPIAGGIMGAVGKKLKAKSLKLQQLWGTILSTVEESISGLRVIKAFNAETQMKNVFESENTAYYKQINSIIARQALAHPMSEFLGTIAISIVLWFGGTLILRGNSTIDAATFIYYMVLFYSIINPAKDLSKTGYTMRKGMGSLKRIDEILKADNPITDPANPLALPKDATDKSSVTFEDVSFSYDGQRKVLDKINLSIEPGQTVAIVGQSGSGKSTLLDLIPRFWDVTSGRVLVDGENVKNYKVSDLRSLMGNVNQEAILFNDTFYANIAFGISGVTYQDVERAARIANAHDFIMQTPEGYNTKIGDRGSRLSGGQRQRISIARAVLKNPALLILDEATSALDTESERLVQEALQRLMSDRTTIVVAHRLSTIVTADKICVMQDGKIVESGTHSELMQKNGYYRNLVEMQAMK